MGCGTKSQPLTENGRELDLVTEYTTYAYDNVLRIYHAKARMYDTENRRFMAKDIDPGYLDTLDEIKNVDWEKYIAES